MNKKIILGGVVLVLIVVAILLFRGGSAGGGDGFKNATYMIDGESVTLVNGEARTPVAEGSAGEKVTKYFGNEEEVDFNEDGEKDVVFLMTQETGGSGVFYYLVGAIKNKEGYWGMSGVLLGDRIAPQTTELVGNEIVVNYADRKKEEPMTAEPTVGVSRYFKFVEGSLVEVVK